MFAIECLIFELFLIKLWIIDPLQGNWSIFHDTILPCSGHLTTLLYREIEDSAINYSPSCRSKNFIFGTQVKIFLMKSESFLSLHWQLHNYHIDQSKSSLRERKTNSYSSFSEETYILYDQNIDFRLLNIHHSSFMWIKAYIHHIKWFSFFRKFVLNRSIQMD